MPRPHAARRKIGAVAVGFGLLVCVGGGGGVASAAVVDYAQDMSGFTAAAGAGNTAVTVNFDDGVDGADITGQTSGDATFDTLVPSPIVVDDIYNNRPAAETGVGYDSFRFDAADDPLPQPLGVSIPLPAALLTTPLMLAVAGLARRRMQT